VGTDVWLAFLASPWRDDRAEAADLLYRHPDPAATPGLIAALADESEAVRWRAAAALGAVGPPAAAAVPALQQALGDYCDYVRARAAVALFRIDPAADRSLPPLPPGWDEMWRRERARLAAEGDG
jgi:HEAT repeat protein